jgi:hypothetical protein
MKAVDSLIGFVIAVLIALTGIGAGTITTPLLILFLHVPPEAAVFVGLTFSAAVKLILVPAQIFQKQVSGRVLVYMLAGGLPGVLIGSMFLRQLIAQSRREIVNGTIGIILILTVAWQIFALLRPKRQNVDRADRAYILPWLMLPVGAEVGMSSAGAGALGSAALLTFTSLAPAQVVGTDIAFGFVTSLAGSGAHWFAHTANPTLLRHLIGGGIVGALVGSFAARSIPQRPLRFALLICLLLIGSQLLYHAIHRF